MVSLATLLVLVTCSFFGGALLALWIASNKNFDRFKAEMEDASSSSSVVRRNFTRDQRYPRKNVDNSWYVRLKETLPGVGRLGKQ